jgi:L-seryl-tRNA(Ser) seleniumtransferase
MMDKDRFGNEHAPGLPYARGRILTSTEDDFRKLRHAWRIIEARVKERGPDAVFNFSGLEHGLPLTPDELPIANDFVAPALYFDRFRAAALDHLGGSADRHDVALFARLTGATYATHLTLVKPGDVVVGLSPTGSHPSVIRAAAQAGAKLIDTTTVAALDEALDRESTVSLVVLTRLAVSYELLPLEAIRAAVRLAHGRGVPVYVDDAGGARVGPAIFDQPRTLELGVDVGATGLDKYGTVGPRLGVLAGESGLVSRIRARAFEMGLEARPLLYPAAFRSLAGYSPERVRHLVETSREVATAVKNLVGERRVHETPVIAALLAEDILEIAMERGGLATPAIVPYEATAAFTMLLLREHGMMSVSFVGLPPGTSSHMMKFIPPETLARFGGAGAYARAVDDALDKLAAIAGDPAKVRRLLFGDA